MSRNQTYEALKRALRNQIILIGVVVATATVTRLTLGPRVVGAYTLLATLALTVMLISGAAYWRTRSVPRRTPSRRYLLALYCVGLIAVLAYPLAFLIGLLNDTLIRAFPDAVVALSVYGLTVAAFLHHGLVKLIRSGTDQQARTQRRQVTARWMRDLIREERRSKAKP